MTERYIFALTLGGLMRVIRLTCSLRAGGFTVAIRESDINETPVYVVEAEQAPRPNRKERGCEL